MYQNGGNQATRRVFNSLNLSEQLARHMNSETLAKFSHLGKHPRMAAQKALGTAEPQMFNRTAKRARTRATTKTERAQLGIQPARGVRKYPRATNRMPAVKYDNLTRAGMLRSLSWYMLHRVKVKVEKFLGLLKQSLWGILLKNKDSPVARDLNRFILFIEGLQSYPTTAGFFGTHCVAIMAELRKMGKYALYIIARHFRVY